MRVLIDPAHDRSVVDPEGGLAPVDRCIAAEVEYLNEAGIRTLGSCCGHDNPQGLARIHVLAQDAGELRSLGYEPTPSTHPNYEACVQVEPRLPRG